MSSGKVEVNDFFGDVSDVFFFWTCRGCWDDPRQPAWPQEVGDYGHWDAAGNSYVIYIYDIL